MTTKRVNNLLCLVKGHNFTFDIVKKNGVEVGWRCADCKLLIRCDSGKFNTGCGSCSKESMCNNYRLNEKSLWEK